MGTGTEIKSVSLADLRTDVLPPETAEAFAACAPLEFLKDDWYLAGGTALALQVGHRESVDLDFFTTRKNAGIEGIESLLAESGAWTTTYRERGMLFGLLHGAKASFIEYPFFRPTREASLAFGAVRILSVDDIAAMKIIAVSQRGKKRDFVDLYWHCACNGGSLLEAVRRAIRQYPDQEHSVPHFIKSLTYFDDAESDPMPRLFFDASWEEVKAFFRREVPGIAQTLILDAEPEK